MSIQYPTDAAHGEVESAGEATETHTHYLMVYGDGTYLCGVVDMLDAVIGDVGDGNLKAIYLVTPDGNLSEVTVNDVTGRNEDDDEDDDASIEWEICRAVDTDLVEYVLLDDEYEGMKVVTHIVWVNGFAAEPQ